MTWLGNLIRRLNGVSQLSIDVSDLAERVPSRKYLEQVRRDIDRLEAKVQSSTNYDIVKLGEALFFVPTCDNLYDKFIPAEAKGANKDTPFVAQPEVTRVMFRYLDILHENNVHAHLLDIGSWVGDIAIRWAIHAKKSGYSFSAECFDPSLAGKTVPYNAELNDVSDMVRFDNRGVSLHGGPELFHQYRGHSDSSRLSGTGEPDNGIVDSYPIRTCSLSQCLDAARPDRHIIVKIDVEGIDAKLLIANLSATRDNTIIIEYAPNQKQYSAIGATDFITTLSKTHSLFDLWYLPRPTRAIAIYNAEAFAADVGSRIYGYTDILAVPKSLEVHDKLCFMLNATEEIEPSYMMT